MSVGLSPRRENAIVDGVLVVDKPRGLTSHDVVARVRRGLGTSEVGHAGTLDPMATGVLVVLVGEATKLCAHITADDKEYSATLKLGEATASLDADGEITERAPVPALERAQVEAALSAWHGVNAQRAPAVSAIKQGGVALHERVRRGEAVEAPMREVVLHAHRVDEVSPDAITFWIRCGKGFYVRSLGRDVAASLGTVGHLTALRRERVGAFDLRSAVDAELLERASMRDKDAQASLRARLSTLRQACAGLVPVVASAEGVLHARQGKRVREAVIVGALPQLAEGARCVIVSESDEPVALAERLGDELRVLRGFQSRSGAGAGTTST